MKPKGRPKKVRFVKGEPKIAQFSPRGRPGRPDETELAIDEYEALRLADYKGLGHREAGILMGLSRQTFERILKTSHKKIAGGIVNGTIIRIQGGKTAARKVHRPNHT